MQEHCRRLTEKFPRSTYVADPSQVLHYSCTFKINIHEIISLLRHLITMLTSVLQSHRQSLLEYMCCELRLNTFLYINNYCNFALLKLLTLKNEAQNICYINLARKMYNKLK